GDYLNTLGVAQYRVGQYPEALETLTRADRLNGAHSKTPQPPDLAFLALTQHQLGQEEQAQATLARLREALQLPRWAKAAEAHALLREAEALLAGPATIPPS